MHMDSLHSLLVAVCLIWQANLGKMPIDFNGSFASVRMQNDSLYDYVTLWISTSLKH